MAPERVVQGSEPPAHQRSAQVGCVPLRGRRPPRLHRRRPQPHRYLHRQCEGLGVDWVQLAAPTVTSSSGRQYSAATPLFPHSSSKWKCSSFCTLLVRLITRAGGRSCSPPRWARSMPMVPALAWARKEQHDHEDDIPDPKGFRASHRLDLRLRGGAQTSTMRRWWRHARKRAFCSHPCGSGLSHMHEGPHRLCTSMQGAGKGTR